MKNPKNKDVGTPRKHGTTSPKKNNIDFTENTPGVMTRSQVKCHYLSTPKKISKEIKTTPTENSRKCSNVACAEPVSGTKRSLRSGVSISIKRQKKEGLDTSDNPDLTDTSIEDDSMRTSKPRYNRCSKEPKNLEGEMNEELDKVKKISTPRVKVKETLNENKLLPDTNKEYSIRSRRSVVNKLENDMSGKGNEPKQINSLKDNQLEIVNESEASQSVVNKDEIRLTRSVSKKLESKINSRRDVAKKLEKDRNDEDIKKGPPSGRESVSKCPEILDENRRSLSTSKEGNAESESGVTKKLENDKSVEDVQITYSETLDENKLSPSSSKGSKAKSRKSMPKKLEAEMSDMDNECKKIKSPEIRKVTDPHIFNTPDSSPKTNKDKKFKNSISKKLENYTSDEDNEYKIKSSEVRKDVDEYPDILYDSKSPPKTKLKRNMSKKPEVGTNGEDNEDNKIISPEVRKNLDEYPKILYDSRSPPKAKLKRNVSKNVEIGTSDEGSEYNKIKSPEVRKDVDEYPEILYDSKSPPKTKLKRNMSKKLEVGTSGEDNEHNKIKSHEVRKDVDDYPEHNKIIFPEVRKDLDAYPEILYDSKSPPKAKLKRNVSKRVEVGTSDEDNEYNKIKSPEVRKDVDEYPEILYDNKSLPKAKLKRNVSKKLEVGISDKDNVAKEIITSEIKKVKEIYAETLFDNKSSPKINKDKSISKKLKSDSSDEDNESSNEDNEHNKIESPEIRKDVDRYLEIHYADKSPKTKLKRSVYKKFEDDTSDENNVVKQVRSSEGSKTPEILYDSKSSPYKNRDKTKLKRNMSLSPAKKAETSPMVENDISDSGSESGKVKISRKESKQQVASIEEHVSLDSSEAETIIFENTGKTLFLSETIKSDKRKNYLDGNEKTVQDSIPPSHEENSVSVGEIFASSSGVTSKILSIAPKRENFLNKKFSSPEKNKGETEFQIEKNFSTKDRISSSETILLPKTTKQAHLSPFRNQTKQVLNSESSDSDSDAESRKAIRESAQKRIIQNISTSESDSKFMRPVAKLYDEQSDSESAPEEMSFSAGRKLEMESLKNVVESINKDKQKRKERRKQRLEKYKQQKEEKLIRLKEKRASQEDASCSSSEESGYEEDAIPVTLGKKIPGRGYSILQRLNITFILNKSSVNQVVNLQRDVKLSLEKMVCLLRKNVQLQVVVLQAEMEGQNYMSSQGVIMKGNMPSKKKQRPKLEKENVDDPLKGKIKRFNISEDEIEIKERKEKKRKHEQMELPQNNLQELPSDVLESLPDQIPLKVPKFDKEISSVDKRKSSKLDKVKGKRQDFRSCNDLDYIPLSSYGSTEFGVMPLEMLSRSSKSMAEQAADFKQRMLYGSHIKRAPANAHLVYQQKLKAAGRDRFAR